MSTTETALTAHVLMPDGHPGDTALVAMSEDLQRLFGIGHTTIQVETSREPICGLAASDGGCAVRGAA